MLKFLETNAARAVVTVGDGRGFIVAGRFVVTAAHCLPEFPPANNFSFAEERTYGTLLALRGERPSIAAECLFADPIADIAVLGTPDNQALPDEADAFDQLVDGHGLDVAEAAEGQGMILSLAGEWCAVTIRCSPFALNVGSTEAGQSGSPILNERGAAVGLIVSSAIQTPLLHSLPGRLLHAALPTRGRSGRTKAGG
jgi:hypothetical protein